jgi:L-asparaginase II
MINRGTLLVEILDGNKATLTKSPQFTMVNDDMTDNHYSPIFQTTRGSVVESIHFGAIAVVDVDGKLRAWFGNPGTTTFMRSSAKPFQALPFIVSGGPQKLHLTLAEVALTYASHIGMAEHIKIAKSIQAKAGISESHLQCGTHLPFHNPSREDLQKKNLDPTPNHNNCSGKHSGMLAYAKLNSWPLDSYLDLSHPLQQEILRTFAMFCGLEPREVLIGRDGCSAPNFAVPLRNAALGYARLCDPRDLPPEQVDACQMITQAMVTHPEMIAGPEIFDTRIMEITCGKLISKGGAEGFQSIGLTPGAMGPGSPAFGIALKISDGGARYKVRSAVVIEILRQLGVLTEKEQTALAEFGPEVPIRNWNGSKVGDAGPCFELIGDWKLQ